MDISEIYPLFLKHPIISTNSRNCPPNSIFFALKGEKFDGNEYIEMALKNGASYAIGDSDNIVEKANIIKVENSLHTLQELAQYHRKQLNVKVIAITGTNGKTTTKELIACALSSKYKTLYTSGNLNNHIGVPLTLLRLTHEHQYAIIEMGANHIGEIHELCQIADPDYGIITNIGKAHLEGFGSLEGVIRAKTELYDFMRKKGGTVFGNLDNLILKDLYDYLTMVYYGTTSEAYIHGQILKSEPTLSLRWFKGKEKNEITTHLAGTYNFENVLAAVCIASYFEVENHLINNAIENYFPQNNRSQNLKTNKNQLIVDTYNANPSSMGAALDNFLAMSISPKMVILGQMNELGNYTVEEHKKIIDLLQKNNIEKVFLIGKNFQILNRYPENWKLFPKTEELLEYLNSENIKGYNILIKGSRGNKLEEAIPYL